MGMDYGRIQALAGSQDAGMAYQPWREPGGPGGGGQQQRQQQQQWQGNRCLPDANPDLVDLVDPRVDPRFQGPAEAGRQ